LQAGSVAAGAAALIEEGICFSFALTVAAGQPAERGVALQRLERVSVHPLPY
jgi:hypothetical protein